MGIKKRVEALIKQARRISDNEEFDNDPSNPLGIIDDEVVAYMNDAQDNLHARISEVHPKLFISEDLTDLVAGQERYALPAELYLGGRLEHVEALFSNTAGDYYTLQAKGIKSRLASFETSFPNFYIRSGEDIIVQPRPSQGRTDGLRITYQRQLPELDIRRGKVTASTIATDNVTDITIDISPLLNRDADLPQIAERTLEDFDFITIVDSQGNIKMDDIPLDSYDPLTGIISIVAGFNRTTGETISVGDYVLGGSNSTTHSQLPQTCQRYLIAYAAWKILKRDSMVDLKDQERELVAMLRELVDSFREISEDQEEIELDDWGMI